MDSDDDYGEDAGLRRLLGFMFGNVDAFGHVDADYLDEDAREHLAALADQLGPSLAALDFAEFPSADLGGAEEALLENGNDEEEEQQQSGGREAAEEEEGLPFPNKEFVLSDSSMNNSGRVGCFLDEEDYDVDDDGTAMETTQAAGQDPPSGSPNREETSDGGGDSLLVGKFEDAHVCFDVEDFGGQPEPAVAQESAEARRGTKLPVLCIDNGMEILRFSEIFGVREPLKGVFRRRDPYQNRNGRANNVETVDVVDAMEDDEEGFLKGVGRGLVVGGHLGSSVLGDCVEVGGGGGGMVVDEHGRDSCLSGQTMKERAARCMSPRWQGPDCPGFYPLDQQDWEDKIVWENSPAAGHGSSSGSCLMSEHDSGTCIGDAEVGEVVSSEYLGRRPQIEPDEDQNLVSLAVSEEAFVSERNPEPTSSQSPLGLRDGDPQVVRLDSCLKGSGLEATNAKSMTGVEGLGRDAAAWCLKRLSLQNKELLDGCWLDQVIWDPSDPILKPKLVLDLQDEQMSFETLEHGHVGQVCSHAGAVIPYYPLQEPLGDSFGHSDQHGLPTNGFNISNDEFYSDWVTSRLSNSYAKRRANHFVKVIHSAPALRLQTMKPKLSNKEIANFHRPKALWYPHANEFTSKMQGTLCTQGSIKIIVRSLGGKKIKLHLNVEETLSSIKSRLSKKLDFRSPEKVNIFYSGKELEDDKSLAIQDVKLNSLLHIVRSKIHLWPTVQLLAGDNESLCPPGAFRRKSDLSLRNGHVFLMEYCEERPLLLGNVGMGARLCTYYRKKALDDATALSPQNQHDVLGNVLTLDPADESPFLGDLNPGCSQSSLETNMYRAPLFPHKLSSTDYLLVRSANGMLSLRRINKIFVVGQGEPHVEVISPGVRGVENYNLKRLLVHVYREFKVKQKSGLHPYIRADELSLQFPSLTEAFLRKRLKHCADLQRKLNGPSFWAKKPGFKIPCEQEIRRILVPEDVCCYESMQAGLHRLKHMGIGSLTYPICLLPMLSQLSYEPVTLAAASHIEKELLITPWNLSSSFVTCVNKGLGNIQCLEITGAGDPSGCGLGFSYIPAAWSTPRFHLLSTSKRKRAPALRVGSVSARADTRADTDLHGEAPFDSLSKLNFHDYQVRKTTRCNQKAMAHQFSSEQVASTFNMDTTNLSNSRRTSYLLLRKQARRKCQEIWDRQVQSLANTDANEYESCSKVGSDLDPFAVDLENLLDVEEFVEGKHSLEHRNEIAAADKGEEMGRHLFKVTREEENEDEAAEAALISIWLDSDEDISRTKDDKLKQVRKGSSRFLTSKDITMPNNELQKIPVEKNLCLKLKAACKGDDVHAGSVEMLNIAVEEIIDKKELIDKPRRQIFACGACGQMGHMKTNKNCPKYREELGASELENVSAKSDLIEAGLHLPLQTSSNKLLRVDISERSDKSGIGVPGRTLQFKFTYVPADKHQQSNLSGIHCSDGWLTPKEKTGTKSITKLNEVTATSCNAKSEDKQGKVQKCPLLLRLPVHQKISFKPPKDVTIVEEGTQAAEMERDDEFLNGRNTSKMVSLEMQKQPSEWFSKEMEISSLVEQRNFLAEEKIFEKVAEERHQRTQGWTPLKIDGHTEAERDYAQKGKKKRAMPVSMSSYSKEYKTSREARRMHEMDQAAKGQPPVLRCHVAEHTLLTKRRRGGEVLLSNILENIVNSLKEHKEVSYLFMKPVSKKEAPDYHDIIKHPMDLSTIKEKVRRMQYKSRGDFRRDVWQINYNAHRYNDGRNPAIALFADQLLEICDHLLDQNNAILTEAEAGIEM